jgi:hypothetical protein
MYQMFPEMFPEIIRAPVTKVSLKRMGGCVHHLPDFAFFARRLVFGEAGGGGRVALRSFAQPLRGELGTCGEHFREHIENLWNISGNIMTIWGTFKEHLRNIRNIEAGGGGAVALWGLARPLLG